MNTATDAIYAETGRTPLVAKRHVAAVKFAIRLSTLSSDKLSRKASSMLVFDDAKGHYNWITLMTELFGRYKIEVNNSNFIIKKKIKSYFEESLKKKLTTAISEQKKLRTYSSFKTVLKFEPYLCVVKNVQIRSCLSNFRMSCHDLEIERGRYDTKPKYFSERYCLFCLKDGVLVTEDEVHFSANCPLYRTRRKKLFEFVEAMYPSVNSLTN